MGLVVGAASVLAAQFVVSLAPSEGFWSFDSFEPWEPAVTDYLRALPDGVRLEFADEGHAIAYALAADCFAELEPMSEREVAVEEACAATGIDFAAVMTVADLCGYLGADGNRDVQRINGSKLCG